MSLHHGLYCISGAFHLCLALTEHTVPSFSQRAQGGSTLESHVLEGPCWWKGLWGPASPRLAGGTLEVAEEDTPGGGWAQTAPHAAWMRGWGPDSGSLSEVPSQGQDVRG